MQVTTPAVSTINSVIDLKGLSNSAPKASSSVGSKVMTGVAKTVGCLGLAAIVYDAHKWGQLRAGEERKNAIADSGLDAFLDSRTLNKPSFILSELQDRRFDREMKGGMFNGVRNFFNSAKGYIKGFAESIVSNVIPLALTAATLLTKGKAAKLSATALAAYGTVEVAKNTFGTQRNHYIG
jgi:hypothetical protein